MVNYKSPRSGRVLDSANSGQIMVAMKGLGECGFGKNLSHLFFQIQLRVVSERPNPHLLKLSALN